MFQSILILGYGSVGKYHAKSARSLGIENIYIVDPYEKARLEADENGFVSFATIDNFLAKTSNVDHAIISNWGPHHCISVDKLLKEDVRSFTIEKPFCTSISEGNYILGEINKRNAFANVHFRWSYLDLHEKINKISRKFDLGPPLEIICHGGAHCLSTGGTHWIDFARKLFKNEVKHVSSNCTSSPINPRSDTLMFLQGYICSTFEDERKLLLNFSNNSSMPLSININYRNARIKILMPNEIQLSIRDPDEVAKFSDKVTRYGQLYPQSTFGLGAGDTTHMILEEALVRPTSPKASAEDGFKASTVIIAALESSTEDNRKVMIDDIIERNSSSFWSFS